MEPRPLAIVTGASSGIGRCIALELGRSGYRIVLIARREHLLNELASELRAAGPSVVVMPMELAEVDAIEPALTDLFAQEGPANVVVNCAGVGIYAPFQEQTADVMSRLMRVNHEAPIRIIRAALPGLLEMGHSGRIAHVMNICSGSARVGAWGHAAYAASKGAMRAMTEVLAAEHGHDGVYFSVVYPGIIATPYFEKPDTSRLWPLVKHRAIAPERVARAVVSAIGRRRVAIYVPAHYRVLDAIYAVSPNAALSIVRGQSRPQRERGS